MTGQDRARSVQLSWSGLGAMILPDGFSERGYVLEIGGVEQSHVDLNHPERIVYEYLRRIANVVDTVAPEGEQITAAHLGAGGLTLPRYIQATRTGSRQVAVEIERELLSLVTRELPLPEGTRLARVTDDARAALPDLARIAGLAEGEGFDVVVLDIFSGRDSPEHLACQEFYAEILPLLSERGVVLVNVGDDPGLAFFARQAEALAEATWRDPRLGAQSGAWVLTDSSMTSGRREGNLILAAGPGMLDASARAESWRAAGPHPGAVLDPAQTQEFVGRLREMHR